jgi:drug/metabolite transporter (DMT)-like permease
MAISGANIIPIVWLGVVNTGIACYLYFSSIHELPAQSVAICSYIDPLSALIFSAIMLNEQLSAVQIVGAILILGGAAFSELYHYKKSSNIKSKRGRISN